MPPALRDRTMSDLAVVFSRQVASAMVQLDKEGVRRIIILVVGGDEEGKG